MLAAFHGIRGEQVAEAGFGQGEVYPEGELYVGRGGVCARGVARVPVVLHVPSGASQMACVYSGHMCNHGC
jgi:hypothetical protein